MPLDQRRTARRESGLPDLQGLSIEGNAMDRPPIQTKTLARFYPIVEKVEYTLNQSQSGSRGCGWTIALSSKTVTLVPDDPLPPAKRIELSIAWPVLLDGEIGLRLWILGVIRESTPRRVTVEILRYEFRIRNLKAAELQPP